MWALREAVRLEFNLPGDGTITRESFEHLPKPPRRWAWELQDGRLELVHMPVTYWHWEIIRLVLEFWGRTGRIASGDHYVADSAFVRGEVGRNIVAADGLVFVNGFRPMPDDTTFEASVLHAIVEAVSEGSEEHDAVKKLEVYAKLGVPHYWIVRRATGAAAGEVDGLVTMYELRDGQYQVVGNNRVSQL
jgi:Uma2 family endonuclease